MQLEYTEQGRLDFIASIDRQLAYIKAKEDEAARRRKEMEMKGVDLTKCKYCNVPLDDSKHSVLSEDGIYYICKKCGYSLL